MTKYYVESGRYLKVVVSAPTPVAAILKALSTSATEEPLRLADRFIVNERGFVWDREERQLYGDEFMMPTSLLMGDPRPDRYAVSEAIRSRLCGAVTDEPVVPAKVLAVLEALADGALTLADLADEMAVSLSAGSDRAQAARLLGLVERLGGRPCRVSLTAAGRAVLEEQGG